MRTWVMVAGAVLLSVAFVGLLELPLLGDRALAVVSNAGQLLAAAFAAAGCAVAASRSGDRRRLAWAWLSFGTGAWAAGQLVWTYKELALGDAVPFPSTADIGFLLFPLAATVGLVIWLGTQSHELVARGRDLLDGAIIAASLLVLSWVTVLSTLVASNSGSLFGFLLGLAYPVSDVLLGTLVLLALARGQRAERAGLLLLTLGLGGLAFSDSFYAYLTSQGAYESADLVSSGWVAGFLLVGVAGMSVARPRHDDAAAARRDAGHYPGHHPGLQPGHGPGREADTRPSLLRLCLPYAPLLAAGTALCVRLLEAPVARTTDLLLGVALVLLVLGRQFLAMVDNHRLLTELGIMHGEREHQALHDPLTGLPNRMLFTDRLDQSLLRPGADVSVLFCDLDDFKLVNDQLGHDAGDRMLTLVAERLLACVRVTDTVARLGGDEFAILVEDASHAAQVADRVVATMQEPVEIYGHHVRTSISVGLAHHHTTVHAVQPDDRRDAPPRLARTKPTTDAGATERKAAAALLLRQADMAMYAAKGAGKSRAVLAETG